LIFDNVEVLDFAGPFEVFSRTRLQPGPEARRSDDSAPFRVFTVARSAAPVVTTGGRRVLPHFAFADAPSIDLLVVPGGFGTRALIHDEDTLAWDSSRRGQRAQGDVGVHGLVALRPRRPARGPPRDNALGRPRSSPVVERSHQGRA